MGDGTQKLGTTNHNQPFSANDKIWKGMREERSRAKCQFSDFLPFPISGTRQPFCETRPSPPFKMGGSLKNVSAKIERGFFATFPPCLEVLLKRAIPNCRWKKEEEMRTPITPSPSSSFRDPNAEVTRQKKRSSKRTSVFAFPVYRTPSSKTRHKTARHDFFLILKYGNVFK